MEDRRGEHRIRTGGDGRGKISGLARATGGDDRYLDLAAHCLDHLQIEALTGAVRVHRVEQDLASAQFLGPLDPPDRVDAGGLAPTHRGHLEPGLRMLFALLAAGIDRQHQHLIAESVGDAADQRRVVDGCGVDAHLVGAATQQRVDVLGSTHASADGHRDEHLLCGVADHVDHGLAVRAGGGHVQKGQLVGTLTVVLPRQLDRVAGITQVLEMHALDHSSRIDI